jgi:dihydrofolate synthase/folylpolyglutamate synthase
MVYLPHWPIPYSLGNRKIDYETVFERMSIVLKKLDNPHQKLPPVIHIAGTNGKGSTSSLIAKIYLCCGYKAHLYTSPHLHDANERIILNGEKISDNFLFEIMEETRLASENIPLTFMEAFTIGSLIAFSKTPADVLVVECGMGGRIDSTNIIEDKLATVITPISFDHTEFLGDYIERIAMEKALIMRQNTPMIVASQALEAKNIIKILADDQKIPCYFYDEDFSILLDQETKKFDFNFHDIYFENLPKPALLGMHQYINFATAITTALSINHKISVTEKAIRKAIETVKWPSRIEKIENGLCKIFHNPESEIWIDGAHNEGGANCLATWIKEQSNKKNFVICGFSKNKCKKEFLEKFNNFSQIIAVRVNGEPYAEDPAIISEIGKKNNINVIAQEDLLEALKYIAKKNYKEAVRVIICGSLHLARDVRKFGLMVNI